jgi:hypothetical protein
MGHHVPVVAGCPQPHLQMSRDSEAAKRGNGVIIDGPVPLLDNAAGCYADAP